MCSPGNWCCQDASRPSSSRSFQSFSYSCIANETQVCGQKETFSPLFRTRRKSREPSSSKIDDLDKGSWEEVHRSPGNVYWVKTFPDEEVPVKLLFTFEMAMPAKMFAEMLHPRNLDLRNEWDRTFVDHEILKTYPDDQGYITFMRTPTSWPLSDRTFVLFNAPSKEIDWFGQQAYLMVLKDAWHQSKPEGADGHIRATNGGNFYVVIPDETDPNAEQCRVFGLTNNNYNGWLPKQRFSWIVTSKVPQAFDVFAKTLVEGYTKYFKHN